jgi:hypothetical protein
MAAVHVTLWVKIAVHRQFAKAMRRSMSTQPEILNAVICPEREVAPVINA